MEEYYSHRHTNLLFLFLFVFCLLLLTARLTGYVRSVKNFLFYVLSPTPEAATRVVQAGQGVSLNLKDIVNVHQENLILRKSLERYEHLNSEYLQTQEEVERLRNIVGFHPPAKMKAVASRIITREPGSWFQWVMIDKGREDGVRLDTPVLAWAGNAPAVFGRVGEVFENSSKVVLVTNVIFALPAVDQTTSQDGLLEGQNGPSLKLGYIVREGKVMIGDSVTTSPLSSVFPSGIPVGTIEDIVSSENDSFQTAIVRTAVDFNNLREAIVLLPDEQKQPVQRGGQ